MGIIERRKLPEDTLLTSKELDHCHSRDSLLEVGVDPGYALANDTIGSPRQNPKDVHRNTEHRKQEQGNCSETRVDDQHDGHDAYHGHEVHEDCHGPGSEHLVQDIHIRGDPRHEPTDRIAVEVFHGKPVDMAEQMHAKVRKGSLGQKHRVVVLEVVSDCLATQGSHIHDHHQGETRLDTLHHVSVDR